MFYEQHWLNIIQEKSKKNSQKNLKYCLISFFSKKLYLFNIDEKKGPDYTKNDNYKTSKKLLKCFEKFFRGVGILFFSKYYQNSSNNP